MRGLVPAAAGLPTVRELKAQGRRLLFARKPVSAGCWRRRIPCGPRCRPRWRRVRALGLREIELLTGDNERVAPALAAQFGVRYRANLLPEDKIAVVREYQARGHTVVMVGDGVNDAPGAGPGQRRHCDGRGGSDRGGRGGAHGATAR